MGLKDAERMAERTMDGIAYWLSPWIEESQGVEEKNVSDRE